MRYTDLEMQLLNIMAHCEMTPVNGARPESASETGTYLWADERAADLGTSEQAVGGVLSSLAKKGAAVVCAPNVRVGDEARAGIRHTADPDGWFEMTEEGFAAWDADPRSK